MPFCRKCGRRLVEYSESCPDCGTSTTAPLIKVKKAPVARIVQAAAPTKVAKAVIPVPKAAVSVKVVAPAKAAVTFAPARVVSSEKAPAPPKPFISAKHFAKPKKTTPPKQTSPFTIVFDLSAAPPAVVQRKPAASPKPVDQPLRVVQPKPAASSPPAAPPKPVAQPKPALPPKPVSPAPVYPPHEIIKSNVSLKEDITTNLQDYETQSFGFDLKCPQGHFWAAGTALPVSNGKAFCLQCGERLRKTKPNKRPRYRKF
jgi:hypothetical protein